MEYVQFIAMTSRDIQKIFRDRHILVLNHPQEDSYNFDLQSLQELGHLDDEREIQGELLLFQY